jgi:hypothetical protein
MEGLDGRVAVDPTSHRGHTEHPVPADLAAGAEGGRRSPRRKTVEITLDRGGQLIIAAPPEAGRCRRMSQRRTRLDEHGGRHLVL